MVGHVTGWYPIEMEEFKNSDARLELNTNPNVHTEDIILRGLRGDTLWPL